jgi:hypothetical protein
LPADLASGYAATMQKGRGFVTNELPIVLFLFRSIVRSVVHIDGQAGRVLDHGCELLTHFYSVTLPDGHLSI